MIHVTPWRKILALGALFACLILPSSGFAVAAEDLEDPVDERMVATLFVSPSAQTVMEGSTFNVSVYLNTHENSVSTMDLTVRFPADRLQIVSPSGGQSLIQLWVQPPTYSNTDGTAHFVGVIPNGIVTQSGLISTITFRAISSGPATVSVGSESIVLANDGFGTRMQTERGRAVYTVSPKPPSGVRVFSDTHPFESTWYQNANVTLGWDKDAQIDGFSYVLDNQPSTIPDDTDEGLGTATSFSQLSDGLHYFHIKARRQGVWGQTTDFLVRIDSLAPADFTAELETRHDSLGSRQVVSFATTDSLSGINHYEVGVVDKREADHISPVFIQTESPYQVASDPTATLQVRVRAFDNAGNIRESVVDVYPTTFVKTSDWFLSFVKEQLFVLLSLCLALIMSFVTLHYLIGHHVYRRLKMLWHLFTHLSDVDKLEAQVKHDHRV